MKYNVEYACLCNKGKVRKENQDNFWCMGKYLESRNDGLLLPFFGVADVDESPAFAVFDGIGGEQCGEMAAYLAAFEFNKFFNEFGKKNTEFFLNFLCSEMNENICNYAEENKILSMGTTAAIIMFAKTFAFICNLGDSKIYKFSNSSLAQISQDHVTKSFYGGRKPALTQCLGIPEDEFVINPYIAEEKCSEGDRFLICSDGLTDMLSEDEIKLILSQNNRISDCAESLMNAALDNGGIDNITIILCEYLKEN
ncbi:MAG: PP2C family serine/threonine-protein phosphatase [Eubacteriales bacterium]